MKKQTSKFVPQVATGFVPTAAATSALLSPFALAETGDLDSGFGDVGRVGPILNGPSWSLDLHDNGSMLLGGGDWQPGYSYWGSWTPPVTTGFVNLLSDIGAIDASLAAAVPANTQVFDVVRQVDDKVVAVGRKVSTQAVRSQLAVLRLQDNGALDTTFGNKGMFELSDAKHGNSHIGSSVVLDPDGRIVVAGSRDDRLIVVRLLPDGSIDTAFGASGIFEGPRTHDLAAADLGPRATILRTASGGYRVTASNQAGCQVVGLTANGVIDNSFGTSGIATVDTSTACRSMRLQADGRLLVAGIAGAQGFAARLLANGQRDATFSATGVSAAMSDATAVAVDAGGSVVVAGRRADGTAIMRLQPDGTTDAMFGNAGTTLIDLQSEFGTHAIVNDMTVRSDGSVVASGGEDFSRRAFVVRLLGAAGGDSPGVLGMSEQLPIFTVEGDGEVAINVRRTGGSFGEVSVAYAAHSTNRDATAGSDFEAVSGRLSWMHNDIAEKQIRVPIISDSTTERPEYFAVTLSDARGGAGLGTMTSDITIGADGAPFGQFSLPFQVDVTENRSAEITVSRDYYSTGAVSVTLTPLSGTAIAGADFDGTQVTVSWADGEWGYKTAVIPIVDDSATEPTETFSVQLSNPTGGAVIGAPSSTTVRILTNDQPVAAQRSGGSGSVGFMSLLLLGMLKIAQVAVTAVRRSGKKRRAWVASERMSNR